LGLSCLVQPDKRSVRTFTPPHCRCKVKIPTRRVHFQRTHYWRILTHEKFSFLLIQLNPPDIFMKIWVGHIFCPLGFSLPRKIPGFKLLEPRVYFSFTPLRNFPGFLPYFQWKTVCTRNDVKIILGHPTFSLIRPP